VLSLMASVMTGFIPKYDFHISEFTVKGYFFRRTVVTCLYFSCLMVLPNLFTEGGRGSTSAFSLSLRQRLSYASKAEVAQVLQIML